MKIAAYLATLVVRLLGLKLLISSATDLIVLTQGEVGRSANNQLAIVSVFLFGLGVVGVALASRIVRLFTADAPLGNE